MKEKKIYLFLNFKKISRKFFRNVYGKKFKKINIKSELQNCWKNLSINSYLKRLEIENKYGSILKPNCILEYLKTLHIKKQKYKRIRFFEKRNLSRLNNFFKFFGFRQNWNRPEQNLRKTKKFKKFNMYKKILNFFSHNKKYSDESKETYSVQPVRTFLSYYKMRWQAVTFFIKNYYSLNLARRKISKFAKLAKNFQKNKIITFIAKIELTASAMLLKMRLLATRGLVHQFIKHGSVYVNYKKITHPLFKINIGDTISIFVDPIKYHFHKISDPLYTYRLNFGLYRRNSGRQSFSVLEPNSFLVKNSLAIFKKKHITKNLYKSKIYYKRRIIYKRFKQKTKKHLIKKKNLVYNFLNINNNKYKKKLNIKNNINNGFTNWKHSFIIAPVTPLFLKQRPYIDKLYNTLI